MKIINTIDELKKEIKEAKKNKTIGLVPTMGALHLGHLSLIEKSTKENDFTVVSIFVNPTQFGPNEDYDKYPRTLEADAKLCEEKNVDVVFAPSASQMYSNPKDTTLVCPPYSVIDKLCGKSRPGHFDGVATVVSKLFNLTKPDRAYFGKKDYQQLCVIKKIVKDLNIDVEIVGCEIVREKSGLALSSRNIYLKDEMKDRALKLSKTLFKIKELSKTIKDTSVLLDTALMELGGEDVEYFEILDLDNLEKIDTIENGAVALLAVKFHQENDEIVRLIDNIEL